MDRLEKILKLENQVEEQKRLREIQDAQNKSWYSMTINAVALTVAIVPPPLWLVGGGDREMD